jgi:CDP-6-deoxy-D-xylo-4-hexulose-3-dehydrase
MKSTFLNEKETLKDLANYLLQADKLSMGKQCALFEKEFSEFQGSKDAILFNSGGSANLAMLQALKNLGKLKSGDKIGFSALTWSTNVMPIIQLGFIPVPVDCDPITLNVMSSNLLKRLDETELQAFFSTNVLGFAGDLGIIRDICNKKGIIFIEDNCEALGTNLTDGKTGSFGSMASFSFFVAHHMSTIEGGMVCTSDEDLSDMLKIVRANGWDRNLSAAKQHAWRKKHHIESEFLAKYTFYELGYNFKPTEIIGFIGKKQLKLLDENISKREKNYSQLESVVKTNSDLIMIDRSHISLLSSFAFPVLANNKELRDYYVSQFSGAGVEIRPMIAGDMQSQPFYKKYVSQVYDIPGTSQIHDSGFYCGNYSELTNQDIQTISSCLTKY